jgi:hypothetical protein
MKIIAVNGFKRAGKGETAKAITSLGLDYSYTTTEVGFADKVKILGAKALGFVDRTDQECIDLMDEAKEKWLINVVRDAGDYDGTIPSQIWHYLTGREYLQNIGNEARGIFGEDFWVDQVLPVAWGQGRGVSEALLQRKYGDIDYLLITDLRYENEAERVLTLGGEVWEVLRPDTESDGHASEQVLPRRYVTRQIDNSGDLMALRYEAEKALGL